MCNHVYVVKKIEQYIYIEQLTYLDYYFHISRYNPYVQARSRIDQLKRLGHSVDKVWKIISYIHNILVQVLNNCPELSA